MALLGLPVVLGRQDQLEVQVQVVLLVRLVLWAHLGQQARMGHLDQQVLQARMVRRDLQEEPEEQVRPEALVLRDRLVGQVVQAQLDQPEARDLLEI
jgi:hypothetical protein